MANQDIQDKVDNPEPKSEETDTPAEPVIPTLPADFKPESAYVAQLLEMVTQAEAHKDDETPVSDFVEAADKMFQTPTGFAIVDVLPEKDRKAGMATFDAFKKFVDTLRDHVEVVDRVIGDQLANGLQSLANIPGGDIKSESDKMAIPILTARWAASAPKSARKGKGGSTSRNGQVSLIPALKDVWGFRSEYQIVSICDVCGTKKSTRKDNLNSHRDAMIGHRSTECPTRANIGNGTNAYQEVTKALFLLGMGNADWKGKHVERDNLLDSAVGGGWGHSVNKS